MTAPRRRRAHLALAGLETAVKVLLIDPPELYLRGAGHTRQVQPLGLAYVGAAVQDIADVRFLLPDTRAYVGDAPWPGLLDAIVDEAPDIIGLTAVSATFATAVELARRVRQRLPDVPIVLGGVHASTLPGDSLRQGPCIDVVVQGEGEATLRELVVALSGPRRGRLPADVASIAGLWLREPDGAPFATPQRPLLRELDTLPHPKRDGLVWQDDIEPAFRQAMVTLRGCPYSCIYCAVPGLDSARTRMHSAARVVDEIEALIARWQIPYLFFHDSVFTLSAKRTLAICAEMRRRNVTIPFCIQTRADRLGDDVLAAMIDVGLHQVFFGVETGTAYGLEQIKKAMPLAVIRDAIARTRAAGVRAAGFFMVGWPWEDVAAIEATIDFATELDLDTLSLFSATPLPGTELWQLAAADGVAPPMPRTVDFRQPHVNLTRLDDDVYAAAFAAARARVDAYNQARMMAALGPGQSWHLLPEPNAPASPR